MKEGMIELDRREIEQIYDKYIAHRQQQQQDKQGQSTNNKIQHEFVQGSIFPTQFIPFCIDEYSRESSLKLYQFTKSQYDIELINQRIKLFYEAINDFKQSRQRQQLINIFSLDEVSNLVSCMNQNSQSGQLKQYMSYFEQGIAVEKVEVWRFKHEEQKPVILYQQRLSIFKDYQLILRVVEKLIKHKHFEHINIDPSMMLIQQYERCAEIKTEYEIKIKCKWVFDLVLGSKLKTKNQFDILQNARKILMKLLAISQNKSTRSQLDQHHYQKIQYLLTLTDIIKLNYHDFYFLKSTNENTQNQLISSTQHKEQLQQLKEQILYLEELAKSELKDIKLQNLQPKLTKTTKENNRLLWSSVEKYILSNVTESERKNILNPGLGQKKSNTQVMNVKKPERKPSATNVKKQTKPQPKQVSKIQKKQLTTDNNTKNQPPKQVIIQATFIASASDIKFRPQLLAQSIENKQSLLYIMSVRNKNSSQPCHIACYINTKVQKQTFNLFGSYHADISQRSFIYSEKSDSFYKLLDRSCAVGYGPEVFLTIGKLDIIVPCFGTQHIDGRQMMKCMSYFPVSYSRKGVEINGGEKVQDEQAQGNKGEMKENELGIEREFLLEDIDIYEIRLKGQ